ncbi:thioesterase II family protein [Nocardia asteroides]|uniref:thioesterase II family protein n=1 Tax=Nocardia asteroides TaxID=1824 RepID=UPI001E59E083|nr:alpha/beta fold hydrolase [Nocardia asteroides]UGT60386.1 alpha/beta fold hydrolase [Nocardia asteroides]
MDGNAKSSLWVRRYYPSAEPEVRLACFPHAGGAASFYLPVAKAFSPSCEVLAIQYPGRQDRRSESPIGRIDAIADAVAVQLKSENDRPLALFGHSMGALIAYEVALRLQSFGISLVALFVSGRRAPSLYSSERAHLLSDDALMAEIVKMEGTDGRILNDADLMSSLLPVIRADYCAVETYKHDPNSRLTAPIYAHCGIDDPRVSVDEAHSWRFHTSGAFALDTYPGGHFYLIKESESLIASIKRVLSGCTPDCVGT